jgi:predicted transcriptional regulator of viral defense system
MNKYYIRYNTRHGDSDRVWRVFENGSEYLVTQLDIQVPVRSAKTIEDGVDKWNIYCEGIMEIIDGVAVIK